MGVKKRWKRTDKEYIDAQHASLLDKKEALYSSLRAAVIRRHYLLKLKAKYAGERVIYKYVNLYWCRWAKDCKAPIKEHYKGDWNSTQHSS